MLERDFCLVTAARVLAPRLGEVEPTFEQGYATSGGQRDEDADLATDRREIDSRRLPRRGERSESIVHLAQAAVVLTRNTCGAVALFAEAALVADEEALRRAAEDAVGLGADFIEHLGVIPRRVGDEVLNALVIGTGDGLGDVLKVAVAGLRLHEAAQVDARLDCGRRVSLRHPVRMICPLLVQLAPSGRRLKQMA